MQYGKSRPGHRTNDLAARSPGLHSQLLCQVVPLYRSSSSLRPIAARTDRGRTPSRRARAVCGRSRGGRLALVSDIRLVGHAEQQNASAIAAAFRQPFSSSARRSTTYAGILAVDLLGQFDETERVAERAHLIGKVIRVDRDAVTAHPGPGIEGLETERLGGGALDGVPQVHAELVAEHSPSR